VTVNAVQRQRILTLMEKDVANNGLLDRAERAELVELQKLAGIAPDAPIALVKEWAAGLLSASLPNSLQRAMTPRQRQVEIMGSRWPTLPLTGKQAVVELLRQKGEWGKQ
jgi:hypothetical protein